MPIIRAKDHVEEYRGRALYKDLGRMSGRNDHEITMGVNKRILATLAVTDKTTLIDVGCGDGTLVSLARRVRRCIGVAPTEEEVARLRSAHRDTEFVRAMAQKLPFDNGFADVLVCNSVLLTLDDEVEVRRALCEFARVCKGEIFLGEIPSVPVPHMYTNDSVGGWLLSLWRVNGLISLLAGLRDIAKAAFTSQIFIAYPTRWFWCEPEQFIRIADECGLKLSHFEATPHVPGRFDYWMYHQ